MMEKTEPEREVRVWDVPTRIFHWALVLLVAFSFFSGKTGGLWQMEWHMISGMAIMTLVLFRLVWGLVGGTHARFVDFIHGPGMILAYVRGEYRPLGHNPLGGLSVLAMLGVLLLMAGTGLFANDDIFTKGPLYSKVGKAMSDQLTTIHRGIAPVLLALIALHLGAVAFYRLKGHDLIRPMLTGRRRLEPGQEGEDARESPLWLAALLLTLAAGGVAWVVNS